MNNIIFNDNDESIGYYRDLYSCFAFEVRSALDKHDVETAQEQLDYIKEIEEYKDHKGLLVVSDNNGMGFTCKPYKEGE